MRKIWLALAFTLPLSFLYSQSVSNPIPDLDANAPMHFCGTGTKYISYINTAQSTAHASRIPVAVAGYTPMSLFPANQVEICGMFKIYYQDYLTGLNEGFADPALGAQRRGTFCAVLSYVDSIIDIPDTIDIFVDQSFSAGFPYTGTGSPLAFASPSYPSLFSNSPGIYNGHFYDHVTTGVDPDMNMYDMTMTVNFHQVYNSWNGSYTPVTYHNDYMNLTGTCHYDLYTVLLHEVTHGMGFLSMVTEHPSTHDAVNGPSTSPYNNAFSLYDQMFLYKGNIITNSFTKIVDATNPMSPFIDPTINTFTDPLRSNDIWINDQPNPENHPTYCGNWLQVNGYPGVTLFPPSFLSHLNHNPGSFAGMSQYSPGFREKYNMGPSIDKEEFKRRWTYGEIRMLLNLGYIIDPIFSTSTSLNGTDQNGQLLVNNVSATRTNISTPITTIDGGAFSFVENPAPDFSILNNNSPSFPNNSTLSINISSLVNITDPDGDPISIMPGSLYGIRGVSTGGNNHNLISINPAGTQVDYTPEPGFKGIAQFAFNLWDGHEKGALKIITINVLQGGYIPAQGQDMVINGDFEDGTEVRQRFVNTSVPNSTRESGIEGDYWNGAHFAGAHPYSYLSNNWGPYGRGMVITNSFHDCSYISSPVIRFNFGSETNSANNEPAAAFETPLPLNTTPNNERFVRVQANGQRYYLRLMDNLITNRYYTLEYDIALGAAGNTNNSPNQLITVQWMALNNLFPNPFGATILQTETILDTIPDVNSGDTTMYWYHVNHTFMYCGTPTEYIALSPSRDLTFFDNVSLRVDTNFSSFDSIIVSTTTDTICFGDSTLLVAAPNISPCFIDFTWYPDTLTGDSIWVSPTSTTTYTVVGTNGVDTDTATITIVVLPSYDFISVTPIDQSICNGDTAMFVASGAVNYEWSTGSTNDTIFVSPPTSTSYTVTATDACAVDDTITVNLTVLPIPIISITLGSDTICTGECTSLIASGATTYSWSPSVSCTGNCDTATVCPISTTTYTVTGTDANGCTNIATITIVVNPNPTVSVTPSSSTICNGQNVSLTASGASTYTWSPSTGLSSTTGSTVTASPSSTITYTVTGTDVNGCTATATSVITITAPFGVNIVPQGGTQFCSGDSLRLTCNTNCSTPAYQWFVNGIPIAGATSSTYYVTTPGNYFCQVTCGTGCIVNSNILGISLFNVSPVVLTVPNDTFCEPIPGFGTGVAMSIVPGPPSGSTIQWFHNGIQITPSLLDQSTESGFYYVVVTYPNGCSVTSDSLAILIYPKPDVTITPENVWLCGSETEILTANSSISSLTYSWTFNGSLVSSINTYTANAQGEVIVTATDANGCVNQDTVNIYWAPDSICNQCLVPNGDFEYYNTVGTFGSNIGDGDGPFWTQATSGSPDLFNVAFPSNISVPTNTFAANAPANSGVGYAGFYSYSTTPNYREYIQAPLNCILEPNQKYEVSFFLRLADQSKFATNNIGAFLSSTAPQISQSLPGLPFFNTLGIAPQLNTATIQNINNGWVQHSMNIMGNNEQFITIGNFYDDASSLINQTYPAASINAAYYFVDDVSVTPIAPSVSVSPSGCVVPGTSVTLTLSGSPMYLITDSLTGAEDTVSTPTGAITYTINTNSIYIIEPILGCAGEKCEVRTIVTIPVIPNVFVNDDAICPNSSTMLIAGGADTYTWSAGTIPSTGSVVIVSPATTTTYTVTGTTSYGCSATAVSTVTLLPAPNVSVFPFLMFNLCPGNTVTLTASGASSYVWSPAIGLNQTTGSLVTATASSTITYTVTGTNSFGCEDAATATLNVNPPGPTITVSLSNTGTVCPGTPIIATASGATSYTWSASPGGVIVTGNPSSTATITAMPGITYTVVGSNGGCPGTPLNFTVPVQTVTCSGGNVPTTFNITTAGQLPASPINIPANTTLTIMPGSLINLASTEFRMGSLSKIVVQNGATLNISGCWLHSCGCLWTGIEVENGGVLNITNTPGFSGSASVVEDALIAVNGLPNHTTSTLVPTIHIQNTLFNKNATAIWQQKNSNNVSGSFIRNSIFTCRAMTINGSAPFFGNFGFLITKFLFTSNVNNLNSSYAPVLTGLGNRSSIGVMVNLVTHANGFKIGDPQNGGMVNIYDNLDYGNIVISSNAIIKNNRFQNLTGNNNGTGFSANATGVGILGLGDKAHYTLIVGEYSGLGDPVGNNPENFFRNNLRGCDVRNYLFYAFNNDMDNQVTDHYTSIPFQANAFATTGQFTGEYGFLYRNIQPFSITARIEGNTIMNCNTGIHVLRNFNYDATLISVNCNSISSNQINFSGIQNRYCYQGIVLEDVVGSVTSVVPTAGIRARHNTITNIYSNAIFSRNIKNGLNIRDNDELSVLYNVFPHTADAIHLEGCESATVENNTDIRTSNGNTTIGNSNITGIYIMNSPITTVKCNQARFVGNCILFDNACPASRFQNNTMRDGINGLSIVSDGFIGTQGSIISPQNNRWGTGNLTFQTFTNNTIVDPNTTSIIYGRMLTSGGFTQYPTNHNGTIPYINTQGIKAGTGLGPFCINYEPGFSCAGDGLSGLVDGSNNSTSNADDRNLLSSQLKAVIHLDMATLFGDEGKWRGTNWAMNVIQGDSSILASDTELKDFYNENLNSAYIQLFNANKMMLTDQFENASQINNSITPSNILESNRKSLNEVILKKLQHPDHIYDQHDLNVVHDIAIQCPYQGGDAVYEARAWYNLATNRNNHYPNICPVNNIEEQATPVNREEQIYFKLYPNPSDGHFQVTYDLNTKENVRLEFYTLQGQMILSQVLGANMSNSEIDLSQMESGVYLYKLQDENHVYYTGRVVIIKE